MRYRVVGTPVCHCGKKLSTASFVCVARNKYIVVVCVKPIYVIFYIYKKFKGVQAGRGEAAAPPPLLAKYEMTPLDRRKRRMQRSL